MEKDKLEIQILLELALNQRIEGEIIDDLPSVLNLYLQKLNCISVAIYQNNDWPFVLPNVMLRNREWNRRFQIIEKKIESEKSPYFSIDYELSYVYGFALSNFGWLILIKNKEFSEEVLYHLKKVVLQLGKELCRIKEEERLKLLQQLFDNSSDAIQIAEESGALYYINKVASENLGILQNEIRGYFVSDFEQIFKDNPNAWQKHIEELEQKGKIILEGQNVNQKTGETLHVEVTVTLFSIKEKKFVIANSRNITKRKQQEKKLKDTTEKLGSILNEMSDVTWSISIPEEELIFVSPAVESLLEVPYNKCLENPSLWKELFTEGEEILKKIEIELKEKGGFNEMHKIITPTGKEKWVKNKGKLIYDEFQKPIRMDMIVREITSEYHTQRQLDQELEFQKILIDIASTYINLDLNEIEKTMNHSLEKMGLFVKADRVYIFDYDFEQMTTSNTHEWCNEGISSEIENLQNIPLEFIPQWLEQHQNGKAFYIPNVLDMEDTDELKQILQSQKIKSLIALPLLDGQKLVGFVGFDSVNKQYEYSEKEQSLLFLFGRMIMNIRNRQNWEKKILLQEQKYRNIIDNMELGLIEIDLEGRVVYVNQTFEKMSGYQYQSIKNRFSQELLSCSKNGNIFPLPNIDSYETKEVEIQSFEGKKKWWFVSSAPNYNDEGILIGGIEICLDITAQKELEKELEKAKFSAESAAKAKELFLANMSHEIRTPLNVIIGMIRQLNKEKLKDNQFFYVKQSESAAKHLLTILNNVLDVAKIESGDMDIVEHSFSPSALVYNVHSIMSSQAKDKNLYFEMFVDDKISETLVGDETRIRQVLINLIGNSIKFTDKGVVNVRLKVIHTNDKFQQILFEVQDTGIGMSSEFVERIFDKFSQEQNGANRRYEGTGLGMAISFDLVKLMGSQLIVESEKWKGTTCSFELMLPIGEKNALVSRSVQIKEGAYSGKKALLVEDNEMNRFIALQSLDFLGFETTEAENGEIAISKIKNQDFDIVFMDIQMPVVDGVEATIYIREVLGNDVPILALTANAFKHDIELYISKGMNDYITKPYVEMDFFRKIDQVMCTYEHNKSSTANKSTQKVNHNFKTEDLFNLNHVKEISRGNNEFLKRIVSMFILISEENCKSFQEALLNKDIVRINRMAHKLKPSLDQMGIVSLHETIRELEKYSSDSDENNSELADLVYKLIDTLVLVTAQLKETNLQNI